MVCLEGVEQPHRAAGVRRALGEVGNDGVEVGDVEQSVDVGVQLDEPQPTLGGVAPELVSEDHLGARQRGVQQHDVGLHGDVAGEQVAQHPDHRGDARARSDEQQLLRHRVTEDEVALGLAELDHLAGSSRVDQVVGHHAVGDRLDRDADAAVGSGPVGERVGAPEAYTVHRDTDAEVLSGHVAVPVLARLDDEGGGVLVSGRTSTMRPRRSLPERSGLTRSR